MTLQNLQCSTPYDEGYLAGTLDRLVNFRSEYAWNGLNDDSYYPSEYSQGYHDGWNGYGSRVL